MNQLMPAGNPMSKFIVPSKAEQLAGATPSPQTMQAMIDALRGDGTAMVGGGGVPGLVGGQMPQGPMGGGGAAGVVNAIPQEAMNSVGKRAGDYLSDWWNRPEEQSAGGMTIQQGGTAEGYRG